MQVKRRAIVISGLPGVGKTTLSRMLVEHVDGHRVEFPMAVAGPKNKSILPSIAAVIRRGRKSAVENGMRHAYADFLKTGKMTFVVDGALHSKDVDILRRIDPALDIKTIHIATPARSTRISMVQLRRKSKGGGSRAYTRAWLGIMDFLHAPMLGLAHLGKLQKNSIMIENSGSKDHLLIEALKAIGHRRK